MKQTVERWLETLLFTSRWLMAPIYVGLVIALLTLVVVFFQVLVEYVPVVLNMRPEGAILFALTLIDISLAANLVVIVIFSGYENFVSKLDTAGHEDRPSWMGTVDFSGLKLKLIASIVAISGIALLKSFLQINEPAHAVDAPHLMWLVIIHLTFVISGVLLAVMDFISGRTTRKH